MVASPKVTHQHTIYAVSEHPRELTSTDLGFICQYTGESSDTVLPHVLEVWRDTKKQDIGCCFGQDTRQLIVDGWKDSELIALDLSPDYWNMGKKLFMDETTLQVPFLAGSMTDCTFISANDPVATPTGHLVGQVDFIWAAAVLHVLSKADCEKFLSNVGLLLKPGGSMYGWTVGSIPCREWADTPDGKQKRFLPSPLENLQESLKDLLLCLGFSSAAVEVSPREVWAAEKEQPDTVTLQFSAIK